MNPFKTFVEEVARLHKQARSYPLGTYAPAPRPALPAGAPNALFFSPHPDDECIVGGIALRVLRESGMRVVNVAVTQGSKKDRQAARLVELQGACRYLGLDLVQAAPNGLERINPRSRDQDQAHWSACVEAIEKILKEHRPKVVIFPHDRDWNSTHIGTHYLVLDALKRMPAAFECYAIETEFWGAMTDPNLMVEISANDLADLITATTFHVGEVARNPYHVLLPAWMLDNVRRGGEVVGGQGGAAPDFTFAAIYRLRKWKGGQLAKLFEGGRHLPAERNVAELFA